MAGTALEDPHWKIRFGTRGTMPILPSAFAAVPAVAAAAVGAAVGPAAGSGIGPPAQAAPVHTTPASGPSETQAPLSEAELATMNKKQRLARAGQVKRTTPDEFPSHGAPDFRYMPAILMADAAEAQSKAWRECFPASEMMELALEVDALCEKRKDDADDAGDGAAPLAPYPPECKQVSSQLRKPVRGYCEFHIAYNIDKKRASLFNDVHNLEEVKRDLGRISKEIGFAFMKPPAMEAFDRKWRDRDEPKVADCVAQYADRAFTYAEINAEMVGGLPCTNVAQEGYNRCSCTPRAAPSLWFSHPRATTPATTHSVPSSARSNSSATAAPRSWRRSIRLRPSRA
jgi:hypothetical protein